MPGWMFNLVSILVMPIYMLMTGWTMWKEPPQEITKAAGYRTERSMQSKRAWRFAQDHAGRLRWKMGWVLLVASAAIFAMIYKSHAGLLEVTSLVTIIFQGLVYLVSSAMTEKALMAKFKR